MTLNKIQHSIKGTDIHLVLTDENNDGKFEPAKDSVSATVEKGTRVLSDDETKQALQNHLGVS